MAKIKNWFKNNILIIVFFVFLYFIFNFELPFYVLAPGGTIDISDRVEVLNDNKINGNLYLMYATEVKATVPTFLISKLNGKWDLYKNEERQISNETNEQIEFRNKILLNNSIDMAIYVAYTHANKNIEIVKKDNYVLGVTGDSSCDFKIGDKILKINGVDIFDTKQINSVIEVSSYNDNISFLVLRDELEKEVTCRVLSDNKIGVLIVTDYEFKMEPKINLNFKPSESGSSGGMMLALSIYDSILEEDLIRGRKIAGTGTIESDGTIGEIGGVKYKIIGASKKNVDLIFVPSANYEEAVYVKNKYNYDMKIVKVKTFDEVIEYLRNN